MTRRVRQRVRHRVRYLIGGSNGEHLIMVCGVTDALGCQTWNGVDCRACQRRRKHG